MAAKKNLAWLIQPEDSYGTKYIRAHVVIPQEDGELHSPNPDSRFDETNAPQFAEFRVQVYLGDLPYSGPSATSPESRGKLWGLGHAFTPHIIETVERAREIARVLDRVNKGLAKATTDLGYVADSDFAGYLARIGGILGIQTYYVRYTAPPFTSNITGERYRKIDMPNLQWWIRQLSEMATKESADLNMLIRG